MADRVTRPPQAIEFVLPGDEGKPPHEQTTVVARPLTLRERMAALDDATVIRSEKGERVIVMRQWQRALAIALDCVTDIKNFPAGAAEPWPAAGGERAKEEYLAGMSEADVYHIGEQILERSSPPPTVGNSSRPAPT